MGCGFADPVLTAFIQYRGREVVHGMGGGLSMPNVGMASRYQLVGLNYSGQVV